MMLPDSLRFFLLWSRIILPAVILYVRFPLSLHNVEDLPRKRGIDISYEALRFWWNRFGPIFAAETRNRRIKELKSKHWLRHLDELFIKIDEERHFHSRAVDNEGAVLGSLVSKTRDKKAALKFLKKTMKRYGQPHIFVTDKLGSYGAVPREFGATDRQETGRELNGRAENSHLPFRRRDCAMRRFRRV